MSEKMGFWPVFALVMGSQIGAAVFLLPAQLAPYGIYSIISWIISGLGAIMLTLVFAQLCSWFPKTGGPHVYVHQAFGPSIAFFTGWTYWIISWVSTTVVIIASVSYAIPLIGYDSPAIATLLQIALLLIFTALNCRGVSAAGRVAFFLTLIRIIPLVILPLIGLYYFNINNFSLDPTVAHLNTSQLLGRIALLTMFGFIGLEMATTSAGSVENPSKTIPRAVVAGTTCVALVYVINSLGIMGIIPGQTLMHSNAPYANAVQFIFGGNWHLVLSALASIILMETLNAWVLTSGQIALGLAQDGLMPAYFGRKNRYDAPFVAIIISSLGVIPLLILTANQDLAKQVLTIIDFSVTAFLFVYITCCLAFFKLLLQQRKNLSTLIPPLLYGCAALIFCCWIIYNTPLETLIVASIFTLTGMPFYLYYRLKSAR
jgi:APA family basic amino acid/polyamine antiporter